MLTKAWFMTTPMTATNRKAHPANAAVFFCVSAIAPSFDLPLLRFERPALLPSLNAYGIPESGPERLYRPPDVLLSL